MMSCKPSKMLPAVVFACYSVLGVFAHGDRFAHAADMQREVFLAFLREKEV